MPKSSYRPGSYWVICDKSGMRTRAENTRKEWTGLRVNERFFEGRHPQDFVRGVMDNQTVPDARLRQTYQYLGPLTTTLAANAAAGATNLSFTSAVRMLIGDRVEIMLDTGVYFQTNLSAVNTSTGAVTINPKLPFKASAGNIVTDLSAVSTASIG